MRFSVAAQIAEFPAFGSIRKCVSTGKSFPPGNRRRWGREYI